MKKGFFFLFLISATVANSQQSLKDALFSGKLKNNAGTVIRKGDDLTKIDTAANKVSDTGIIKAIAVSDSVTKAPVEAETIPTEKTLSPVDTSVSMKGEAPASVTTTKDNNTLWKDYANEVISSLKTEVLPSKKVKQGTYYVLVTYTIEVSGQVTINDVLLTPENASLQQQIKDKFSMDAPLLNPTPSGSGTPRKINKRYSFTLTKE